MDLTLNNLQRLICHKTQTTNHRLDDDDDDEGQLTESKNRSTLRKTQFQKFSMVTLQRNFLE